MNRYKSEFKKYYEKYSVEQLKNILDLSYNFLFEKFNKELHFGLKGSKDFLSAILLLRFDKSVEKNIGYGICMVFDEQCDPLDFSEFMYDVIGKSNISIEEWVNIHNYIDENHKWIEKHKCV